jgi:hypothetical protein
VARLKPGQRVRVTSRIWRTQLNRYGKASAPAGSRGVVTRPRTRPLRRTTYDVKIRKTRNRPSRVVPAIARSSLRKGKKRNKPLQFAIIGLCLVSILFLGQLISAQKKKPPSVAPHSFWAVALAHPPATRTVAVRPSGQVDLHTVDGRFVYPAYREGSVVVVGDLASQRDAQRLLARLQSAKSLGAHVICVGPVAFCRGPTV